MSYWLLKTEPSTYSAHDLARDGTTRWDGIANALALKHLRAMKPGDQAFVYHTGSERACVAIADVVGEAVADPKDPKAFAIDVRFAKKLKRPVTLAEIKADPAFAEWGLVTFGRLSVVPTTAAVWKRVLTISGKD
jgi:predicted RNA-binding protein with PUA-like domain